MEHIPASATASIDAVASKARSAVIVHIVAPIDAIIISPTAAAAGGKSPTSWGGNKMEKSVPRKKRGAVQLLRAAMNMVRFQRSSSNKKKNKPPPVDHQVKSKGTWKRMVGSMRPLTLQESLSPPRSPPMFSPPSPSSDQYEDVMQPPYSPASSSCGGRSRYASAQNLQELDLIEEDSGAGGEAHVIDAPVEKAAEEGDAPGCDTEEADHDGCDTEEAQNDGCDTKEAHDDDFDTKEAHHDGCDAKEAHHDDGDELIDSKADDFIAQFYEQMRLQRLS